MDHAAPGKPLLPPPPERHTPKYVAHKTLGVVAKLGAYAVLATWDAIALALCNLLSLRGINAIDRLTVNNDGKGSYYLKFTTTGINGKDLHPIVRRWVTYFRLYYGFLWGLNDDPGWHMVPVGGNPRDPLNLLPETTSEQSPTLPHDPTRERRRDVDMEQLIRLLADAIFAGVDPRAAVLKAQAEHAEAQAQKRPREHKAPRTPAPQALESDQ